MIKRLNLICSLFTLLIVMAIAPTKALAGTAADWDSKWNTITYNNETNSLHYHVRYFQKWGSRYGNGYCGFADNEHLTITQNSKTKTIIYFEGSNTGRGMKSFSITQNGKKITINKNDTVTAYDQASNAYYVDFDVPLTISDLNKDITINFEGTWWRRGDEIDIEVKKDYKVSTSHTHTIEGNVCKVCQHGFITYTSTDDEVVTPNSDAFGTGVSVISNTYKNGVGIMELSAPVTTIAVNAFAEKTTLKTIEIPQTVTSIGNSAFSGCSLLTDVTCLSATPAVVGTDVFTNLSDKFLIKVPSGSVFTYKDATGWNGYNYHIVSPMRQVSADNYTAFGLTSANYTNYLNYYTIGNAEELYGFAGMVNIGYTDINAILIENIKVNDTTDGVWKYWNAQTRFLRPWTPIGNDSKPYTGTFNGKGHTIAGLYHSSNNSNVGLFGFITKDGDKGGKIDSVGVLASYFKGKECIGGVCGVNYSTVSNSYSSGSVEVSTYYDKVGGVCGVNHGTVSNCYSTGSVKARYIESYVGGVCGYNYGTVINSYSTGSVEVSGNKAYVGGVCGYNYGTVSNSYCAGSVKGAKGAYVGGVCGMNFSTVINSYSTDSVEASGSEAKVGGVCGYNNGTVSNSYNTGSVEASGDYVIVGGVSGGNFGTVINSYSTGSVEASGSEAKVGGVCGYNIKTVSNCYSTGSVEVSGDNANVGDVCGLNGSTVSNCSQKSLNQFKNGEVAYLLNNGNTTDPVWKQTIGTDDYPVFSGDIVIMVGSTSNPSFLNLENPVVSNVTISENEPLVAVDKMHVKEITYDRKVVKKVGKDSVSVAAKWGTLCLPFDFVISSNTTSNTNFFQVEAIGDGTIELRQLSGTVVAGTPVIYYATEDKLNITASEVDIKTSVKLTDHMGGSFSDTTINAVDKEARYYLKDNMFMKTATYFTLNAYRAYIFDDKAVTNGTKSLRLVLPNQAEEGVVEETVEDAVAEDATVETIYNVSGLRVSNVEQGRVYIFKMTDGSTRKIVVK